MAIRKVLYLHGFNSSERSHKAQILRDWLGSSFPSIAYAVPRLPDNPDHIAAAIEAQVAQMGGADGLALIGSSMGGFFANYFAERLACPCVLINPVVYAHKLLSQFIGEHRNPYTGAEYILTEEMMHGLEVKAIGNFRSPQSRMVLLQQGDEVLDYRQAEAFFAETLLIVEEGGDHGFVQFENWLPRVEQFLQL